VEACPVEAMVRDEHGVVRRRLARCIGCGSCARACPFGVLPDAPSGLPTAKVSADRLSGFAIAKCDLCFDRTAEAGGNGNGAVPRCVAACPTGALIFADERRARELELETLGGRTTGEHPFKRR
jgi:Fe-S-cluster-containing dehydrogenase component